jgi:hypothetical protein
MLLFMLQGCVGVIHEPRHGELILHYVRSNQDGTRPEHVVQFRPNRRDVAVYKWVNKCTTAAYVTARMDEQVRGSANYVAGKVDKDGSQTAFGTLMLERATSTLVARLAPSRQLEINDRHLLKARPFLLYDFDFADLNAFLQTHRPRTDFSYELPVIWPGERQLFRELGRLYAKAAGEESHLGRRTFRFDLVVQGPTPSAGTLWIDAADGFIVEATLGLPNHQEYRDFRLRLEKVHRGGQADWQALTSAHYADCPGAD